MAVLLVVFPADVHDRPRGLAAVRVTRHQFELRAQQQRIHAGEHLYHFGQLALKKNIVVAFDPHGRCASLQIEAVRSVELVANVLAQCARVQQLRAAKVLKLLTLLLQRF